MFSFSGQALRAWWQRSMLVRAAYAYYGPAAATRQALQVILRKEGSLPRWAQMTRRNCTLTTRCGLAVVTTAFQQ